MVRLPATTATQLVDKEATVLEVALERLLPAGTTGTSHVTNSASDLRVLFSQAVSYPWKIKYPTVNFQLECQMSERKCE